MRREEGKEGAGVNYLGMKLIDQAIVCPIYSNGGLHVSFRALSLFARQDWLDCPYKKDLVRQFYTLVHFYFLYSSLFNLSFK